MNSGGQKRKRTSRVTALELPPGFFGRTLGQLREHGVILRLAMCLLAAVVMWLVTVPWLPRFPYRTGDIPRRDILATAEFTVVNEKATLDAQDEALKAVKLVYVRDAEPLVRLREQLKERVKQIAVANALPAFWPEFLSQSNPAATPAEQEAQFQQFRKAISTEQSLAKLLSDIDDTFKVFEGRGLLDQHNPPADYGSKDEIAVYPVGSPAAIQVAKVSDVLIGDGSQIREQLANHAEFIYVAERLFYWLEPRLEPTLKLDPAASRAARQKATDSVPVQVNLYSVGQTLAQAGRPLTDAQLALLRKEYTAMVSEVPPTQTLFRGLAGLGMLLALFLLCGIYVVYHESHLLKSVNRLGVLLTLSVITVGLAHWFAADNWRAELIPLLAFAMTVAIAYEQELSLLLSFTLGLVIVSDLGLSLAHFVVMMAVCATAIFMLRRVRSRSKLIIVGVCSAVVAFAASMTVGILEADPVLPIAWERLLWNGVINAAWTLVTGFLISGALPFIESQFGVVTDISLLELGDVSHPLLQELVRRAPGTYNHSINVASIGDAAAEAIGANGLLVRVGAYFHDIGKMLKPQYFVENQGQDGNRHESLAPAMSALIIIAHVKDGADLARQHGLPDSIVDFVEQHHGTTLVEFFYKRAKGLAEEAGSTVLESDYRYPGPKPQTKEAAVMMIADAVESASRVLTEPTPARIRSLVHELAMKRLLDGQFDECGLNLRELKIVEDSLVKSLTAMYHSRVRYPDQKTA